MKNTSIALSARKANIILIKSLCLLPYSIRKQIIKFLRFTVKHLPLLSGTNRKPIRHTLKAIENFETQILNLFEKSYSALLKNNLEQSVVFFQQGLNKTKFDDNSKSNWLNTFKVVANYYVNGTFLELEDKTSLSANYSNDETHIKKIFVSGMNWSGSGAMYDYLNEFNSVESVKNEIRLLEGENSIKNLSENINNNRLKIDILNLFRYSMFSYSIPVNSEVARCINSNVFIKNKSYFPMFCFKYLSEIICKKVKNKLNQENFTHLSSHFFDNTLKSLMKNPENHFLLNNVIHIYSIEAARNISNYNIFCFFRDPRSNYAALYNENIGFHKDVHKYIEHYRQTVTNFSKLQESDPSFFKNIHTIQFEKFILSEKYRESLADFLGLDLSTQNKHTFFKPWKSEKNVYNYKEFKDQKAISIIETELSEYLWDGNL